MANCIFCGKKLNLLNKVSEDRCFSCAKGEANDPDKEAREKRREAAKVQAARRDAAVEAIIVTTELQIDQPVAERLGVITAECAYGMNALKDLTSSVRNIVGGRSEAIESTMRDARETALYELKEEAHARGADAVIALDLDYVPISNNGWTMILLVASGTAVKLSG